MRDRVAALAADRAVRLGSLAAIPPLWFAFAWADVRLLALAAASIVAATWGLRVLERRRGDDEPLVL